MDPEEITEQQLEQLAAIMSNAILDPSWAYLSRDHTSLQWDWPGWLPQCFLTILAGQTSTGKSTLCLRLAASYLDGRPWPDGTPFTASPGKVLWVESESSHYLNLAWLHRWRLDPAQIITPLGNPRRSFNLFGPKGPHSNMMERFRALVQPAAHPDVRLIVLDSLNGLLTSTANPRRIRDALDALAGLASSLHKPILLTHHLTRPTTFDPAGGHPDLDRLLGSPVIAQVPRLIWGIDFPNPTDPHHRRLTILKNNLGPLPDPLGFHIDDEGLQFGPPPQAPSSPSQLDHAVNFLINHLAAGPLPASQVKTAAQAAGITRSTLKRAKKYLRLKSRKQSDQWIWHLPAPDLDN